MYPGGVNEIISSNNIEINKNKHHHTVFKYIFCVLGSLIRYAITIVLEILIVDVIFA